MVDSDLVNFILEEIKKGKEKETIFNFLTIDQNLDIPKDIFEKAYIESKIKLTKKEEVPLQDNFLKSKQNDFENSKNSKTENDLKSYYESIDLISKTTKSEKKYPPPVINKKTYFKESKVNNKIDKDTYFENIVNEERKSLDFTNKDIQTNYHKKSKKKDFYIFKILLIFFSILLFLLILFTIILPLLNIDVFIYFI